MKLGGNPMAVLIENAKKEINQFYDARFSAQGVRAYMYKRKAESAQAVLRGDPIPETIQSEADLKGLDPIELSEMIIAKNSEDTVDAIDTIELERQKRLVAAEAATTPDELQAIIRGENHVH